MHVFAWPEALLGQQGQGRPSSACLCPTGSEVEDHQKVLASPLALVHGRWSPSLAFFKIAFLPDWAQHVVQVAQVSGHESTIVGMEVFSGADELSRAFSDVVGPFLTF